MDKEKGKAVDILFRLWYHHASQKQSTIQFRSERREDMLAEQRARAILQQLSQRQTVSVAELCQITGALKNDEITKKREK